ncbi:GNAT family N-acetyltransferase [Streptomyces sp. NPDC005573]|uniref:GNAT family N-acetyltransferase n=1 Tax=Streptomyces sp. NPDC005573 TaxID=3156890 RepID=UPI0033B0669E
MPESWTKGHDLLTTGPADRPERPRRRRDTKQLSLSRITTLTELERLRPQWWDLYVRCGERNPFLSPDWVSAWARHFTRGPELDVLTVFRQGRLIGVVPAYVRRVAPGMRTLHLMGNGRHAGLTELPGVLTEPTEARSVLRAAVRNWCRDYRAWDWCHIPLSAEQGWFEPEWLAPELLGKALIIHKTTRPSVVLPLPRDGQTLRGTLKRNVQESTRRARNRLDGLGRPWGVTAHTTEEGVRRALPALDRLHAARAEIAGPRRHPDVMADGRRAAFLSEVLPLMARTEQAEILTLDIDGVAVAAQAVLRAPRASYLTLSGVDPLWWRTSPVTLLHLAAAERAIAAGHVELNLSCGPDVAKLRWSEQVEQHPEFVLCGPRLRSRVAYTGYAMAAQLAEVRREAVRHRTAKPQRTARAAQAAGPATRTTRQRSAHG